MLEGALALQGRNAGAFSIVLGAIPRRFAEYITVRLSIPTIGIGARPGARLGRHDDALAREKGQVCATVCRRRT